MKPLVEIGFMPEALSSRPTPYRHGWKPGGQAELFTGWSYPPTDYDKWRQLVYEWVRHSVDKFGQTEVESWWWEVWNEPDIGYWHGTVDEYEKLYDYAADGLKRALPTARIGGPHVTGPNGRDRRGFSRHSSSTACTALTTQRDDRVLRSTTSASTRRARLGWSRKASCA